MIAPPQRITSPRAPARRPPFATSTPTARALEEHARDERAADDLEVRAPSTGCRYARAALSRRARWRLRSKRANPSWLQPFTSSSARSRPAAPPRRTRRTGGSSPGRARRPVARRRLRYSSAPATARLHALEVRGGNARSPSSRARLGRPLLVVERVPALEDHPVDRARPAEDLPPRVGDAAAVHERLRLGRVAPVVARFEPIGNESAAGMWMYTSHHESGRPASEDEDARRRDPRSAGSRGRSRGAAADDDDVVPGPRPPLHGLQRRSTPRRAA